jgi:ribosomal protein S18 acetylase RimI-like enzyme
MTTRLRPETQDDLEFSYQLYASTREQEMALTTWNAAQKEVFLRMQFNAQREHYLRYYPTASFQIIEYQSRPIGRMYVDRWEKEIRLMDIALLPDFCGQGLGSRLIQTIMEEGQRTGKAVSVHVEQFNPARRLYQRMGFQLAEDKGVYHLMRWTPAVVD